MNIPVEWQPLVEAAARGGQGLTPAVLDAARALFERAYAAGERTPGELSREYTKDEYLLIVDADGRASGRGQALLEEYRRTLFAHSQFSRWFQEVALVEGADDDPDEPVLLAARWLAHLVGLRHQTVDLFLDPPGLAGYTLVQVRGMGKIDSPGMFDLPCAGHAVGTDGMRESLEKELGEELGLRLDDLEGLEYVGALAAENRADEARWLINVERRHLYRARLKAERVGRARFCDGEVAALAVFALDELRELTRRFPERAASGLLDTIHLYT